MIERPLYVDKIMAYVDTPFVKILTGVRRCGKSTILKMIMERLKTERNIPEDRIISCRFDSMEYEDMTAKQIYTLLKDQLSSTGRTYLFLDEVQEIKGWEKVVNSLASDFDVDLYITGSNAFLLSADLATLFTGRYIEIHVFPFSFREYCRYYDETDDKENLFEAYSIRGGLAGSYVYKTEADRIRYIKEVYETIVTRDLVQKYSLPDTLVLRRLSEFLMDNISNLTSPNKVSQLLTANKTITNHVTVGKYIKYLCNAFVFYDIKRYDIRGKKYLESSEL